MTSANPQKDYEDALKLKEEGNEAFKNGDNKNALKCYSRIFMHLGMNPCMNMASMTKQDTTAKPKDPLEVKCDELRLSAFNNMAAVYAKMKNWEDCKEKCTQVLKHDPDNVKALFRRGKAYRLMGLYDLARADLTKAYTLMGGKDKAIEAEFKLLDKEYKNADQAFLQKMHKAMKKDAELKKKKKEKSNTDETTNADENETKNENENENENTNENENHNGDKDNNNEEEEEENPVEDHHNTNSNVINDSSNLDSNVIDVSQSEVSDKTSKTDAPANENIDTTTNI